MRLRPLLAVAAVPLVLSQTGSFAAPTCNGPVPTALCGDRIVAEPEDSVSFHQFDGPLESVKASLEAMEALAPDFLEVNTLAEWNGDPDHVSFGGRDLFVVRITDESVPADQKVQAAVSLSVHGLEAAGREGGLRYVEDLARWGAGDRAHLLWSGDTGIAFSEVMRATETWIGFTNSDGWAAGDLDSGEVGFRRGNDNGAGPTSLQAGQDLNRDYATVGWFDRSGGRGLAESEPETRAWATLVRERMPELRTSTDIHGEITTPNDAFSDLIIPAGQWTPQRQEQVDQLSRNMIKTVERKFAEQGVVLDDVFGPLPADGSTPRQPANVATAYDIVGYDDSGFMGDWFSQTQDSVHMDVENFLSNLAPNNLWNPLVEQAHVAAVRGNIEATIVEAMLTDDVTASADHGRVAYVDDALRTSSDPAVQDGVAGAGPAVADGETQVDYDVSRLDYYDVLREAYGSVLDPVSAEAIAGGADLSSYDTLVVTDLSALPAGSTADLADYLSALDAFAQGGGQLVLTDRAVHLLDDLGVVAPDALTLNRTDAGHVDFLLAGHPFEQGLIGKPSQTYYEVMLGFPSRGRAPNYGVERGAWEAAGGTTVATVGDQGASTSPNTALGTVDRGLGRITIFGAILPQAIEELRLEDGTVLDTPHPHGLASYAVTISGGQVLDNVLAHRGVARTAPPAEPVDEPVDEEPVVTPGGGRPDTPPGKGKKDKNDPDRDPYKSPGRP